MPGSSPGEPECQVSRPPFSPAARRQGWSRGVRNRLRTLQRIETRPSHPACHKLPLRPAPSYGLPDADGRPRSGRTFPSPWHLPARISSLCGPAGGFNARIRRSGPRSILCPSWRPSSFWRAKWPLPAEAASGPAKSEGRFCRWSLLAAHRLFTGPPRTARPGQPVLPCRPCRWESPSRCTQSSQSGPLRMAHGTPRPPTGTGGCPLAVVVTSLRHGVTMPRAAEVCDVDLEERIIHG